METAKSTATKWLTSWQFWLVVAVVIGLIYAYKTGKKDEARTVPENIPYPPDSIQATPAQLGEFSIWAFNDCPALSKRLNDFFNSNELSNATLNKIIKNELLILTDKKLVYLANHYGKNYYKKGKGSLVKDLDNVWFVWGNLAVEDRDKIVIRLQKLGAK